MTPAAYLIINLTALAPLVLLADFLLRKIPQKSPHARPQKIQTRIAPQKTHQCDGGTRARIAPQDFKKAPKKLPAKLAFCGIFAWLVGFNAPIFDFSLCEYFYALFDTPSVMLGLVSLVFIVQRFAPYLPARFAAAHASSAHAEIRPAPTRTAAPAPARGFAPRAANFCHCAPTRTAIFPPKTRLLFAAFGAFAYLGFFFPAFDWVHFLDFKAWLFLLVLLCLLSYRFSAMCGVLGLLCLSFYAANLLDERALVNYFIDPFLWLWCVFSALYYAAARVKDLAKNRAKGRFNAA